MSQLAVDRPSTTRALSDDALRDIDAYWRACNYLALGMLYLRDNPLLREPLAVEHIKQRLVGHWGSDPGQSFVWVHLNRVIKKYDLNAMYIAGPGHGAPATLANAYLEGRYSEVYPDKSEDEVGSASSSNSFRFRAASAATARRRHPGRSTRAVNSGTACRMRLGRRSTIPICS
jgi:xylulose-5-phosphate/fructose-6-phosphate phosphoketolase